MEKSILGPIARPIAWILAAFYSVIPNFGVAIIGLSILWMIIIAPLTLKSTRSMLAMQALQPEIKRLQEKHRNDRQAFAQAQMELFRERKVSPLSSCLPSLLPMPVFFALFEVIDGLSHTITSHGIKTPSPQYLNAHTAMYHAILAAHGNIKAFGLNLSQNAFSHHSSAAAAIPFFVLLLIMIGTSYLQTAMTMNRNPASSQNPQMKYMKYLPVVFGIICARFPAGVVLYYAVSNTCRIAQQYGMYRWDPRVKALVSEEVRDVEAKTRDIDREEGITPDDNDGQGPAVAPRMGFRELLAQTRRQPDPPPSAKPAAGSTTNRPGSVKANRNRNGTGTNARAASRTGTGGSVKRPGASANGSGGPRAATASSNGANGSGKRGTGSAKGTASGPKAATSGKGAGTNKKAAGNGAGGGKPRSSAARAGAAGHSASGGPTSPRNRRRRGR